MEGMNGNCIFVTGATGNCGKATIKYLCENYPTLKIMAGVRDTKKAKECFSGCKNLEFCQMESPLNNPAAQEELCRSMKGCGACLIVPPTEDRVAVSKCYIECAKKAGIEYLCLITSCCVDKKSNMFHRQFKEIETCVQQCGLRHSFLRCDFFMENNLMDAESVKRSRTFTYPANPDAKFVPIACCDIGAVAGTLMAHNLKGGMMTLQGQQKQGEKNRHHHHQANFHLTGSQAITMTELAALYTKVAKTDVKYVQCNKQECLQRMIKMGMPQWQAEGVNELWDMVNEGMCQTPSNCVEQITGKRACTMDEFIGKNANLFCM